MFFWKRWLLLLPFSWFSRGHQGKIARLARGKIWYDCFGKKEDQPLLLLMGAGCQGVLWTESFCHSLASRGFFVIRFDYRDTGFSSYFDYSKTPYLLDDLALDALALLDHLGIQKAHFLGISMGGMIAQILGAYHAKRVLSLTLIATTNDLIPLIAASEKKSCSSSHSSPSKAWFNWLDEVKKVPFYAPWKKVKKYLEGWKILNGCNTPFDEVYYADLMRESVKRQRSSEVLLNHSKAILASLGQMEGTKGKIVAPTLIVQGGADPLFPKDHGDALASSIPGSRLLVLESMGHNWNPCFYEKVLDEMLLLLEKS